jgi:flagellar motor switch protein FliG
MIVNAQRLDALRGIQKVAVIMASIGETASADILKHLTEDEVEQVSHAVARLGDIGPETSEALLEEFHQMTVAQEFVVRGGLEYAKKMLNTAFGSTVARRLLDRLSNALGSDVATFDVLHSADPQQLAKFIHNEHPQTIALVLSHLKPSQAAALLASLPAAIRADVAIRMASLDQISPEIVQKIAAVIGQKLKALGEFSRESAGGTRAVAELFNRLDSGVTKDILAGIEKQDPPLFEAIRHLMFVFEDLLLVDAPGIKEIVAKVDRKVLTTALKGTSERLRNWIFGAMSESGADMLREDIEALGPLKIREVEAAQQQIISLVRKLEVEGVISSKSTGGEQYVV